LISKLPSLLSFQDPIDPNTIVSNYDPSARNAIYDNQPIYIPTVNQNILGDSISMPNATAKRIEVDLTTQRLYGFENNNKVFDFTISSGKWNRTPNGTFQVWAKVRSQKMSGGSKDLGTYYYLPNVPYILFFYNNKVAKSLGYSLHGTYWHNNFGVPMSHGCINMRTTDVSQIYNWAGIGTTITIYGKFNSSLANK
jgi:lipoprotein-anchoring transpeptidase ErfK/SrfK